MSRRSMLSRLAVGTSMLGLGCSCPALFAADKAGLSVEDESFLEELEHASFRFFWECADRQTGLVKDRNDASDRDDREVASTAATGFGLTALCIADQRGWLKPGEARERVRKTLQFLLQKMPHEHGFFHHFVDWRNGARVWKSEVSSIDTAILLCGVLTCRQHFEDAELRALASSLYDRVDWVWMMQGGTTLSHGWKPEGGFLPYRWDIYCEHMMLYLLAMGSRRHPISAEAWHAWSRPQVEYAGVRFISPQAPLFVHQYSHAWVDFRNRHDRYADYFENSVKAIKAHRKFCVDLHSRFPHFNEDLWGITASDSPKGYVAWGGPPQIGPLDGTVVPCAAGGSLPFLPTESVRCLRGMKDRFGRRVWKRYGLIGAFNPASDWYVSDVLGIDAGITLLMAENARTGFVWRNFMKNEEIRNAMDKAGFNT